MATPVRIGINGFGRIGRKVARLALNDDNIEIAGINDPGSLEANAHLLKHDSLHGELEQPIQAEESHLVVGEQKIPYFSEKDPTQIPWGDLGVSVVHECTGKFREREKASLHLQAGAKKVLISAPAKDPDLTLCLGVNDDHYQPDKHHILSNASCTTNCLAPVVKVLDDAFGVEAGTMLTVHSYTNDQSLLDASHKDLRRARAAAMSQIPTSTGAAKAVGVVIPHLEGKLDGLAVRVPTPNVSLVDFTGTLKQATTEEEVKSRFQEASQGKLKHVLGYSEEPLVSADFNGNTQSAVLDAEVTTVMDDGRLVKLIAWYDNESGFSQRMLDVTRHLAEKGF